MQAIKQQHSPNAKKCVANNKPDSTALNGKSVAQRVMEVANSNNNLAKIKQITNISTAQATSTSSASAKSSNNSIEGHDQEVEDITNRAAKLGVGAVNGHCSTNGQSQTREKQASAGDQNNNSNNGCILSTTKAQKPPDDSEPLLQLGQTTTTTSSLTVGKSLISQQINGATSSQQQSSAHSVSLQLPSVATSESRLRQILAKDFNPEPQKNNPIEQQENGLNEVLTQNPKSTENGTNQLEQGETRISLDTKVPHPSKGEFQKHQQHQLKEEEVSYYNDRATNMTLNFGTCEPKVENQQGNKSSIRPKSVVTSSNEHKLNVNVNATACGSQQQQQRNHQKQQQQQQLNSREYLNQVVEDDDYDTRYDALVEEMVDSRDLHQQHQRQLATGHMSVPSSPKAKSAPATPCNVTPTAFHQNTSHLNSILNPNSANTLPPDIRKNISATCRVLPSSMGNGMHQHVVSSQYLDELIKQGDQSLEQKDYSNAIRAFSQCIELARNQNFSYLRENFRVYSQRAEAHFNLENYNEAIDDSITARELNPKYTQAYYRQGRAQFLIGEHADSLAVFSFGLAQDPASKKLLDALVDAALKSVFGQDFEPKYNKLKTLDLDQKPFIVVSILGQELLSKGNPRHAAIILESALKLGADHKKFKGSVLSTLSCAYCLMKDYEKAVSYIIKELEVESELEDVSGQCRVLSNLGYTYYKMRKFDKSLDAHRKQLNLAFRTNHFQQASIALNATGHLHAAKNDFSSALTSHTRCLEILKQLGDNDYSQFKELLSIGHIYSMLNDYKASEERYSEAIQLLKSSRKITNEEHLIGRLMVNFNLAHLALKKQSFTEATEYYSQVMKLARQLPDPKRTLYEMRACNGMGQAHRLFKNFNEARNWFEKQLQLAEVLKNKTGQSQALCNLGMTYQHFKDYNSAWKLFDDNLRLVDEDPLMKAYAHSYVGSMYFLMNRYNEAQHHYESSSNAFKNLNYCSAERKTIDLNMAAVHERMGHSEVNLSNITQQKKIMMA